MARPGEFRPRPLDPTPPTSAGAGRATERDFLDNRPDTERQDGEISFDSYLPNGEPVVHRPELTAIGDDFRTHMVRRNVRNEGEHDVVVHGTESGAPIPGLHDEVHPEQIVRAILDNPHYEPGTPVRLLACFSGNEFGWAQYVSDRLGVPVRAPSDAVGAPRIPGSTAIIRDHGVWVTYHPNTEHQPTGTFHERGQLPDSAATESNGRRSAYDQPPGWDFMGRGRSQFTDPDTGN